MDVLHLIAENRIQQAMKDGLFDNLPGKGKPLQLDENAFEDPVLRTAYRLLKDQGFTLPWIEIRREIEADLEAIRREYAAVLNRRTARVISEGEWRSALRAFQARVKELNRRILSYNIQAPSPAFHLLTVRLEGEGNG